MSNETKRFYEFGDFRLDARERILYCDGKSVALKPKAIETLIVLIEARGEVVSKDEIFARVWQNSFVEENSLSVNIYALRKAFAACDADALFIETVSRRGFRFAAEIREISQRQADVTAVEPISDITVDAPIENPARATVQSSENLNSAAPEAPRKNTFAAPLYSRQLLFAAVALVFCATIGGSSFYALRGGGQAKSAPSAVAAVRPELVTDSIEARQFYLRGRELWQTRNNAKMAEGIEFFRRAIALDAQFAAPYIGIADSLSMMRDDAEEWRQAEEYAVEAVRLAPASADALATLGFTAAMNRWDWRAAEIHFKDALELDPNSGKAHQWYATLLMIERRFPEAETHLKRAIEIEPLSPTFNCDLCEFYVFADRGEEALAQCSRTNVVNPDFQYVSVSQVLIAQKRYDEAARERIGSDVKRGLSEREAKNATWYKAFQRDGIRGWMQSDIDRYKNYADVPLGEYNLSIAYARIGDKEETLRLLEKCLAGRAFMLPFANANPEFDFLRDDERFRNLMRRVGLNRN